MSAKKFVIGIDGGTESIRAGVFNIDGTPLSFSSSVYPTSYPNPSWAEQNPADWWQGLGTAVKQAVSEAGVSPSDIGAICVDTTCCTVVALNDNGHALRPALLWMDMRSAAQAARVAATGDAALCVNSAGAGPVSAEWMIPKALWIKENEPEVFDSATYICEYQDFINYHLTGRMCASVNNVSIRWHYNTNTGWPSSMLQTLGLDGLLAKWPQEVLKLGDVVGGLTSAAGQHLGLPEGLPVAQGGADAFIGMVGLGVLKPGQMALLTGSSHLHLGCTDASFHGPGVWGTYSDAVVPGVSIVEGGQTSTGSAIAWYRRLIGNPSYEELNAEAAAVPPGCEGAICLDHFQGNRTPHTDPLSRGSITGLTLKHSRGHVFRSLIESVCFGTEEVLEAMRAAGYSPSSIVVAGGATRSDLWLQCHADVSGVPFILTKVPDAPALGCAVLAAVAAGAYPDIQSAADAMVAVDRVINPDPLRQKLYKQYYSAYKALYPALKPGFHAAARGNSAAGIKPADGSAPASAPVSNSATAAALSVTLPLPLFKVLNPLPNTTPRPLSAIVSPSILSADFSHLARDVNRVADAGAEWVHVDVFDGNFVPNLTIGPPVVKSLRKNSTAFLDCHLCVLNPQNYVKDMVAAGASQFTFHIEAEGVDMSCDRAAAIAADVRAAGIMAGIALAPETPAGAVFPLVEAGAVDTVLLLSVRPGFGGQKFMPEVLPKVAALRQRFPGVNIEVDGGITLDNAATVAAAGANALVAGTTVFAGPKPPEDIIPDIIGLIKGGLVQAGVQPAN